MITPFDPHTIIKKLAEAEPFASLRVECPCVPVSRSQSCSAACSREHFDWHDSYRIGSVPFLRTRHPESCQCGGQEYLPEPDVEKACWRVAKILADDVRSESEALHLVDNLADKSILLIAEAWLDEKREETP